jgi:hypothetical protein
VLDILASRDMSRSDVYSINHNIEILTRPELPLAIFTLHIIILYFRLLNRRHIPALLLDFLDFPLVLERLLKILVIHLSLGLPPRLFVRALLLGGARLFA